CARRSSSSCRPAASPNFPSRGRRPSLSCFLLSVSFTPFGRPARPILLFPFSLSITIPTPAPPYFSSCLLLFTFAPTYPFTIAPCASAVPTTPCSFLFFFIIDGFCRALSFCSASICRFSCAFVGVWSIPSTVDGPYSNISLRCCITPYFSHSSNPLSYGIHVP
ncbi:hypothetical protein AX774_g4474, partial [Zancudomyces culisetae]